MEEKKTYLERVKKFIKENKVELAITLIAALIITKKISRHDFKVVKKYFNGTKVDLYKVMEDGTLRVALKGPDGEMWYNY